MQKHKLTLNLDKNVWVEYKKVCLLEGSIPSKQIENFMRDELDARKVKQT